MKEIRAHGANPEKLYASFGLQMPNRIIDFSTNVNAVEQRKGFSPNMGSVLEDYPDDECLALRSALSEKEGLAEENILVGSGSNESIYILASYETSRENRILQPVYGEYLRALNNFGAFTDNIFGLEGSDIPKGGTVWICNPCNPTGNFIPDAQLDEFMARLPNSLFIVDEAYRDFIWTEEVRAPFKILPNVIRLRSLTKIYNLCGARVGYVISSAEAAERLKKRQPTWSVSGIAQEAALFFLGDKTLPTRTKEYYAAEMPRLLSAVKDAGFAVMPTCVNYFLMETGDDAGLMKFLLQKGIVVRHTRNFPGLDGKYVRIAARTRLENDVLISALRDYR